MNPRQVVIEILNQTFRERIIVDLLIEQAFKQYYLSTQNRAFVYEIVQGTLRWHQKLAWTLEQFFSGDYQKSPLTIRNILESSLYQIFYLTRTPDYAAVNEAVNLAKKLKGSFWARRVNAVLRTVIRQHSELKAPSIETEPVKAISVIHSHPEWLVERWINRFGSETTQQLCHFNNQKPRLSIRVNRLVTSPEKLFSDLTQQGLTVQCSPHLTDFLRADQLPVLTDFDLFQQGHFSIQDESAGLAVQLLASKPAEIIADLCAAPGGKTTYIAELSNDQAFIVALDNVWERLKLIRENKNRLRLKNIHFVLGDAKTFSAREISKLLLDVPCSGSGVLAKRTDLRWQRTLTDLHQLQHLQRQLIRNAATLLPKNGVLVYSTCTIEPEENEEIIESFLAEFPNFELEDPRQFVAEKFVKANKYIQTLPHVHGIDGSFAARLIRKS